MLAATAILYLAREVLIPLALAVLLSFLLAPAVRQLERWKLPRLAATLLVALLGFSAIGAVVWVAADQAISLAAKLPEYRHNIVRKIHALRAPGGSDLGKAADAIKDLENEAAPERPPMAVAETPATPLQALGAYLAPVAKPVATAMAVLVFTILMLLNRENLRDRLLVLLGPGRIQLGTRAIAEASYRVSRYLSMQLMVNALFGIPFGIALYFIGIPNAMLWGLLGVVLRFIPYAGVWIAGAMPALLAFAISDGWSMVAWTLGVFFVLEMLLVNAVEPWLYGRSAGLSPIAIILAAIFWTWLWGPVGLLLATPLTVCVAVVGRYVPEFGFLNVLLGVEPVLGVEERFYQRLVALDQEEAQELAEKHTEEKGLAATLEQMVIPALRLAESDRAKETLEPRRQAFIYEAAQRVVDELPAVSKDPGAASPIGVAAAHDTADHIAANALCRVLAAEGVRAQLLPHPILAGELVAMLRKQDVRVVCVSAVPPQAVVQAGYLIKKLKSDLPSLKVLAALWTGEDDAAAAVARLRRAGADAVATRMEDAVRQLRDLGATLGDHADRKDQAAHHGERTAR